MTSSNIPTKDGLPMLAFNSIQEWEEWLDQYHSESKGLWLRIYKKASRVESIDYAQALEVALCYGWIDSQKGSLDSQSWLQRFTPRRANSVWSKVNTKHIERLLKEGRMKPAGLQEVEKAKKDGRWDRAYSSPGNFVVPADLLQELDKRPQAKRFFETLNKKNVYAITQRLEWVKRPATRVRRMQEILAMLERGDKLY